MKQLLTFLFISLFIFSCQPDEDPLCDGVTCENGGDCLDGTCNCPEMWTGTFCEEQKTPLTITIESFSLSDFPQTQPSGNDWDNDGDARPDIFFSLENPNGSLFRSETKENRSGETEWVGMDLNINEVDFTRNLTFVFFDDDITDSEFMGEMNFQLYDSSNSFPETLAVAQGDFVGTLTLSYNY